MAVQTHTAAMHSLVSVKLAGASVASATLKATIEAALVAAGSTQAAAEAITARMKHADMKIVTGTLYMEDDGTTADANSMPYEVGEKREIRNCRELLKAAKLFASAAYDVRVELYS